MIDVKYEWNKKKDKMVMWIAWHMPKWLVYWCSIRLMAHATTGKYGNDIVDSVSIMDALKRWEDNV